MNDAASGVLSSWVTDLRHKNPLDHAGRSAAVLASMQIASGEECESRCPECGEPLRVCVGDEVAPYLSHSCSDAEHRCPGSCETVWHLAAKRAASRMPGWSAEVRYEVGGRSFRADAMNANSGKCLEFVHTLSRDYASKHIATKESGRDIDWVFDGNGPFCRRCDDAPWGIGAKSLLRFDTEYAAKGQLVARGCLRRRARQLVAKLGVASCFLHFHGLAFQCFQCGDELEDLWGMCQLPSLAADVIYGEGGLNDELIRARAAGLEVVHRGLETNHTPDHLRVIDDVRSRSWLIDMRREEKRLAVARESSAGALARGGRWVDPEDWPGVLANLSPPCKCGCTFAVDVPIHEDKSTRRDCAKCSKFISFTRWYGVDADGR